MAKTAFTCSPGLGQEPRTQNSDLRTRLQGSLEGMRIGVWRSVIGELKVSGNWGPEKPLRFATSTLIHWDFSDLYIYMYMLSNFAIY